MNRNVDRNMDKNMERNMDRKKWKEICRRSILAAGR